MNNENENNNGANINATNATKENVMEYTEQQISEMVRAKVRQIMGSLINKINADVRNFALNKDMDPERVKVEDAEDLVMFATEGCKQRIRHNSYNDRKADTQKKIKEVLKGDIDLDTLKELKAMLRK
jgi:5-methylcytosine-specific restriction endonuclease McrBC GTP-binding regulatory subunit McrB